MRQNFTADWAFGIQGAVRETVRKNLPQIARKWPLLQSFDFEAYELPSRYMAIILRSKKLVSITSGPGVAKPFPFSDHPTLPPQTGEVEVWQFYLRDKFDLREEDAAFLIPLETRVSLAHQQTITCSLQKSRCSGISSSPMWYLDMHVICNPVTTLSRSSHQATRTQGLYPMRNE
jgi:hypothetical protein